MSNRREYARRWGLAVVAAAAAFCWPGMGLAQEQPEASNQGLILDTEPPGLFLLYSGDVIGYVEPCG